METFSREIHQSPVNSPHKGQWRGALLFSLICAWINNWVNNRKASDLRCHRSHYDVIVMYVDDGEINIVWLGIIFHSWYSLKTSSKIPFAVLNFILENMKYIGIAQTFPSITIVWVVEGFSCGRQDPTFLYTWPSETTARYLRSACSTQGMIHFFVTSQRATDVTINQPN